MAKIAFSDVKLRSLPLPAKGQASYWDDKLPSFGVRVSQGGSKTFVLNRNNNFISIGKFGVIGLSEARSEARRLLAEFTLGKIRPQAITFPQAVTLFLEDKAKSKRARTVKDYKRLLNRHFPFKGQLADVSYLDVERRLSKVSAQSEYNHALACGKTFFQWCIKRRYITDNPTTGLSPHARQSRSRVLSDNELKAAWTAAGQMNGQFGTIVKLLVLTGQRRMEIASLRTNNFNGDLCTLPSTLTKNGREHTFPIGELTSSVLSSYSSVSGLLFPARGSSTKPFNGWSKSKTQLDKLSGINEPWTLHDLRRTFATRLAEMGVAPHVIERLLNHVTGQVSGVAAIYNRATYMPEMQAATLLWENRLKAIVG